MGCGRRESGRVGYLRLGGPVKLIDRSQVLVGEVLACGHKGLENRVQQWHRGLGALLNLAYELEVLRGKPDRKAKAGKAGKRGKSWRR